jgi:hypothetical protein
MCIFHIILRHIFENFSTETEFHKNNASAGVNVKILYIVLKRVEIEKKSNNHNNDPLLIWMK